MKNNVLGYEIDELKQLVDIYPWFSWAREELLYKVVDLNPECLEDFYSDSMIFFPRRELVLFKAKGNVLKERDYNENTIVKDKLAEEQQDKNSYEKEIFIVEGESVENDDCAVDFKNIEKEENLSGEENIKKEESFCLMDNPDKDEIIFEKENFDKKIVVIGGDYFSQEDLNILDEAEKVKDIKIIPFNDKEDNIKDTVKDSGSVIDYDLPEFYTETLAKIYTEQEYYKEAIDVYSKLILLYPEKSAYFASLVKEIKLKN
jgi:hypothetical protein